MSIRCWHMVPGRHSELGRRLCSAKQAWRLHTCHQTTGLDPSNHIRIVEPGPAIIRQPKQKNRNVQLREYLVQYVRPPGCFRNSIFIQCDYSVGLSVRFFIAVSI